MAYFPSTDLLGDVSFRLRAPMKGQLNHKNLYSAYNKHSLSSIPNNYEIYLLPKSNRDKQLNSIDYRKESAIDKNKASTGSFQSNRLSHSIKGYGNGFRSHLERFDDFKDHKDKFSPGPGEYKLTLHKRLKGNNLRYKSLFNGPLIINRSNAEKPSHELGPGFYSPSVQSCFVKDPQILNSAFSSKNIRFKELKPKKLGPGSYDQVKESKWNTKLPSFFFKNPTSKRVNNLEKYINTRELTKLKHKREFDESELINKKQLKKASSCSDLAKVLVPQELKEFNLLMKEKNKMRTNEYLIDKINRSLSFNAIQNERKASSIETPAPFMSNGKKTIIYDHTANHLPGPCYYQRSVSYYNHIDQRKPLRKANGLNLIE